MDYHGRFYQAEGIRLEPNPIQQPYPPVYIASNGADTFPLVGSLGHSILVTPLIITVQGVSDGLSAYRETLAEHGHDESKVKVVVNVPVYVGETAEAAKAAFAPTVNNYLGTLRSMQNNSRGSGRAFQIDYEDLYHELGAIGTPEQVIERLEGFKELYRPQEIMCWFNIGGMLSNEEVGRSMQLFADEVIPYFRDN